MRLFLHELRGELLLYVRSRELAFFTFLLPILFLVILGYAYGDEQIEGHLGADYLVSGMIGYGVASTAFAGLAIVLVIRREEGILKRLRATPFAGDHLHRSRPRHDDDRLPRRLRSASSRSQ